MSKDLFFQMRELEAFELSATKKDCITQAQSFVKQSLDAGNVTKQEALAKALRYETFISEVVKNLKNEFVEKDSFFGVTVTPTNGRKMIQYSEDPVYLDLQNKLKQREELLKTSLACDEPIYDSEGIEVPKVCIKYSKDSLTIKF